MTVMSDNIDDYKTSVCNVDKEKRNFPGVKQEKYFTLEEMTGARGGMTETDSITSGKTDGMYAGQQKSGKQPPQGGTKLGMQVKLAKDTKVG